MDPRFEPPPGWSIRTPRMRLRLLEEADRAEFVRVHEVSWELFRPWFATMPEEETFDGLFTRQLERGREGLAAGTQVRLVGRLDDGRIGAFLSLSQIVRGAFDCAYAGWAVNAEVCGQGLGTEGVAALLDFAFAPLPHGLGLHRVQANIIPANAASLRVAEKNGFRLEGLAKRYLRIAGEWQDHRMYAKLAEEHVPVLVAPDTRAG
jgi:[ribosomal protein S5]-alanine N-acetyltransferase